MAKMWKSFVFWSGTVVFSTLSVSFIFVLIGKSESLLSSTGNSTNIKWHECSIGKVERPNLLKQRGCVIWITGLSASGKSSVACALSRMLYGREKLSYVLDGDNVRHGLNSNLSEVAKLFVDAGVICIASLISLYKKDRDACRAMVFLDVPLEFCEARDPKGLYKLARARKIKGTFIGIDDPYKAPLNSEIVLTYDGGVYASPSEMAEEVISYLISSKNFLQETRSSVLHCVIGTS
ncbi:hypothetical protein UlMin_004597 [Ulmus minor]